MGLEWSFDDKLHPMKLHSPALMANHQQHEAFGSSLWGKLQIYPLGSLTKRELELAILDAADRAGLIDPSPHALAASMRLTLNKANGYLTDLALRRPPLTDAEGRLRLAMLLESAEVLPDQRHLSFPLHDPALKLWLDRKLASAQRHHGDGIRSNIAKLSPATLLALVADADEALAAPHAVFKRLQEQLGPQPWITEASKQITTKTTWDQVKDAVQTGNMLINLAHGVSGIYGILFQP